ncbi:DUF814 domain-containing protein [bacterium]|nr:DUF814 domain-containing protein [bacterium]
MDLPLPLSLRKLGLWHGLVWVLRLEGCKTYYLYLAPNPINAILISDSSPKEEYPEATDQLGTLALTLKDIDLRKLVFHPETSIVSLYFSDRRILHLHFSGAHATLLDECGIVEATSCKRLKAKEAYTPPPDRTSAYEWGTITLDELKRKAEDIELSLLREALAKKFEKEFSKTEKKLQKIEEDLKKARNADHYRRLGDLLKINYNQISPRQTSIELQDVFEPDAPKVEIKLLEGRSPKDNVAHYYQLAQKAERGFDTLKKRHEKTAAELAELKERLAKVSDCSLAELKALNDPAEDKPAKKEKPAKSANPDGPYKVYRCISSDGFKIIIGRSANDNDYVTLRLANGNDGWLHVRDYPGSHAIIRSEKGREITPTAWKEAAELCAALSKAPDLAKVDVIYTYKKFVSKPRNAKAGSVLVAGGKNIVVKKDTAKNKAWRESHYSCDFSCN